ncbi:MAG: hypothetical protein RMX68_032120 [Aulosira sp. ZfuVER01]|nr:hypothetical protein [Aulosira sp. ZfuVER01]MDZ8056512.1 hypothetical protein [Aulosira sp. ZfuCHP01]
MTQLIKVSFHHPCLLSHSLLSNATCYNGGNPNGQFVQVGEPAHTTVLPAGSPVTCGGKPSRSAGLTATQWLLSTQNFECAAIRSE